MPDLKQYNKEINDIIVNNNEDELKDNIIKYYRKQEEILNAMQIICDLNNCTRQLITNDDDYNIFLSKYSQLILLMKQLQEKVYDYLFVSDDTPYEFYYIAGEMYLIEWDLINNYFPNESIIN